MNQFPRRWKFLGLVACSLFAFIGSAWANSKFLNVQGTLTDNSGNPLTGNQTVTFRLYTSSTIAVGANIWNESDTIALSSGIFNVTLGTSTSMDALSFGQIYYLGIQVAGDANELSPRQQLGASAYAQASLGSFTIGGSGTAITTFTVIGNSFSVGGSTFVVTSSSVGVNTKSPQAALDVNGSAQFGSGATKSTFTAAGLLNLATPLSVGNGGTGAASLAQNGVLYGNGTSAVGVLPQMNNGGLVIGGGSAGPSTGTLTAGAGVIVTNANGAITVALTNAAAYYSTGSLHCILYTTTGQTTWYYPAATSNFNGNIFGYLIGGGGAGSGGLFGAPYNAGGGGGSGLIGEFSLIVTTNLVVNISSGAAGARSNAAGASGNASCFGYHINTCADSSAKLLSVIGGVGGGSSASSLGTGGNGQSGGSGGTGTGTDAGGSCSAGTGGGTNGSSIATLTTFFGFNLNCDPGGTMGANGGAGSGGGGISGDGTAAGAGGNGGASGNDGTSGTANTGAGAGGGAGSSVGQSAGGNGASGRGKICWYQ